MTLIATVYDADCNINAFPWFNRIGDPNDEETRRQRYRQYFGQVQCGISMMRQFLESLDSRGLLAEATIVIQGDHGSRITIGDKRKSAVDDFSPRDLRDVHSTLFAIRRPGISVGTDDRQISVSELIRHHLIDDGIQKLVPDSPHVYITGTADHYVRIPLPPFAL